MDSVDKKFPELSGLIDPKAELQLLLTVRRIYEYIDFARRKLEEELRAKIDAGDIDTRDFNELIGIFSQPLAGSSVSDPLLQSILQSFGPQNPNHVFAGPAPSFRPLTLADLPAGISGYDTVEDEGIPLTQRSTFNFTGAGVTASDSGGVTEVNIPGSSAGLTIFDVLNM